MTVPELQPLVFEPILLEKVWGGRRLERFGKRLPPGAMVGESWELADLQSPPARSRVARGPLAGRTLPELVELWGRDLLGKARPTAWGGFPLLVKFLDARENLSVQVHPSAAYAAANPGAHLKSECWYVLEAAPGSRIYKGVRPGTTPDEVRRRIEAGTLLEILESVPAVPGECHLLPSGTCHALGAGVLVAEIQTPSDTTFRLWDWGRPAAAGRAMHIEEALACLDFAPPPAVRCASGTNGEIRELAATEWFTILCGGWQSDAAQGQPRSRVVGEAGVCTAVMMTEGRGELRGCGSRRSSPGRSDAEPVAAGDCVLVPAALAGTVELRAGAGESLRFLEVSLAAGR